MEVMAGGVSCVSLRGALKDREKEMEGGTWKLKAIECAQEPLE